MARLNDPQPPPESIENLRRRFTRQNRDLVRNNTAQAIRIRNLETEVARLLAENLSLRQSIITETEEVARLKSRDAACADLLAVQSDLAIRIAEAHALVGKLGPLPQCGQRKTVSERQTSLEQRLSTPTKESWQRRQSFLPSLQDQESRLPAISEDKSFPRLTLDPAEIQAMAEAESSAQTDSPDLGPPPVTHFEAVEAKYEVENADKNGDSSNDPTLPLNLDRRRKRRTSSFISEMDVPDLADEVSTTHSAASTQEPTRSSAKRKLDASELENEIQSAAPIAVSEQENFVYHRKPAVRTALAARKSNRFTRPADRPLRDSAVVQEPLLPKESRKALANKSANSPTKKRLDAKSSDSKDTGVPVRRIGARLESRRRKDDSAPTDVERPPTRGKTPTKDITEPELPRHAPSKALMAVLSDKEHESHSEPDAPPKTPFIPDDLLSPPSSKPSGPTTGRATQEAVIMNSVEDVLNGSIGRGSRRAKAAVSYAEPSLRDKMRRPGKELVGAVEGYERKAKDGSLGLDRRLSRTTNEDTDSSAQPSRWLASVAATEEPGSPLREKQVANEKRKRETIDLQAWAQGESQGPARNENEPKPMPVEKGIEGLSIFDHPVSSPSNHATLEDSSMIEVKAPATSRRKAAARASTVASSDILPTTSSSDRRYTLQPTSSAASTNRVTSSRPSFGGSAPTSSVSSLSRPSAAASKGMSSSRDYDPSKSSAASRHNASSSSLLRHRRNSSDVTRRSTSMVSMASTESNISNSDVEDESDYEPTNLGGSLNDSNLDNSSVRATRRRSMVV